MLQFTVIDLRDAMAWIQNNTTIELTEVTMSNNKQSIPNQGYYFCTLITGEFFSLYYDGRNFHSQERTYKQEEIKTFIKINYEQ